MIEEAVRKYGLLKKGETVVVGVSGGPDSVALLYCLNALKKRFRLKLHVAHLDHMLRKDSGKDLQFVEALAARLRLPVTSASINVKALADKGSLEEIARNARLGFLFRVAKETKAGVVALGHNSDDQAETVLMRVLRGTGLYGLSGILPKREIAGYRVIRPLLGTTRAEINAFLKKKKVAARVDRSNYEEIYFRNKIRNNLLPLLEKYYNRNIKSVLCNLAETSGDDYDYLARVAGRMSRKAGARLELKKLRKTHPALRRLNYRLSIESVKGDLRRITLQHVREIDDLVFNRPVSSIVDLPQGMSVVKTPRALIFHKKNKEAE